MDDISRTVAEIVVRHARELPGDPDADLSEAGLDSLALVGLVVDLEASFAVMFPSELLRDETFRTVNTIAAAVRQLVTETETGVAH